MRPAEQFKFDMPALGGGGFEIVSPNDTGGRGVFFKSSRDIFLRI